MSKNSFLTLDDIDVAGKRVLVRMDLNVPMQGGRVMDTTRITRLLPTLEYLIRKKAKVIVLSHLGRPDGKYIPSLSLAPLVDAISQATGGVKVSFGVDCIGPEAEAAVAALKAGQILLLENLRFHAEEEKNSPRFAKALAALGDIYVNDAFSCAHRSHASVVGVTRHLPSAAGRLMQEELEYIARFFTASSHPITAIVGGAKISSKLALLENLIGKVDNLIIGGAMAHTFLLARGHKVGKSLAEPDLKATAKRILDKAAKSKCTILLPEDVVSIAAGSTQTPPETSVTSVAKIPANAQILDAGPQSYAAFASCVAQSKTLLWNGPLGMFEKSPFDATTIMLARVVARLTAEGKLKSIAGGGDTAAALAHAGVAEGFSYVSTAGGAFLEWMEGKTLPGVLALQKAA